MDRWDDRNSKGDRIMAKKRIIFCSCGRHTQQGDYGSCVGRASSGA